MASRKRTHEHETDNEDVKIEEPKKRKAETKSYKQRYKTAYRQTYGWSASSRKGDTYAFCMVCKSDISIAHSGAFDLKRHEESKSHKTFVESTSKNTSSIKSFFGPRRDESGDDMTLKTTRAEALICGFVAENNLSLSSTEKLANLIRDVCPDSKVASGKQN